MFLAKMVFSPTGENHFFSEKLLDNSFIISSPNLFDQFSPHIYPD